jgi:hypothetical protein
MSSDSVLVKRHVSEVTSFRGIYEVKRCLPDLQHVYHSEVGVVGLIFPDARVVDLAGLQSLGAGTSQGDFQARCQADRPEVIFLPHKNYAKLNAEIAAAPCLRSYERFVDRSSSPLHIRTDLSPEFEKCAPQLARWRVGLANEE